MDRALPRIAAGRAVRAILSADDPLRPFDVPRPRWKTIDRSGSRETMSRLSAINRRKNLLVFATLATFHVGCDRTPAETSLGVEGTTLSCADGKCDIVFYVDNQMPDPTRIKYRAVLSDVREEVIFELSDEIELPALEKTKVSQTVSVIERPDRLRVTVTTLHGL